jgi:hypothetical protein
MMDRNEIAEAARYADARSEELGLDGWASAYGVELDGLVYVAQQRALRAAMMLEGRNPKDIDQTRLSLVRIQPSTERFMPLLTANWLDGFAAGLTAKDRAADDEPELPFAVGLTATRKRLGRFSSHDDAAAFIGTLPDYEDGRYYLDGPEQ